MIGRDGFGVVVAARKLLEDKEYAAKVIRQTDRQTGKLIGRDRFGVGVAARKLLEDKQYAVKAIRRTDRQTDRQTETQTDGQVDWKRRVWRCVGGEKVTGLLIER